MLIQATQDQDHCSPSIGTDTPGCVPTRSHMPTCSWLNPQIQPETITTDAHAGSLGLMLVQGYEGSQTDDGSLLMRALPVLQSGGCSASVGPDSICGPCLHLAQAYGESEAVRMHKENVQRDQWDGPLPGRPCISCSKTRFLGYISKYQCVSVARNHQGSPCVIHLNACAYESVA